jgi:hypothetical protein
MNPSLMSLVLVLSLLPGAMVRNLEVRIPWAALANLNGKKARIVMPSGDPIEGSIQGVEPDALLFKVSKTANSSLYPKGQQRIPRASVKALDVRSPKSAHGRWIAAGIGSAVGGTIASSKTGRPGWFQREYSGGDYALIAVGSVGGALLGYLAGRKLDGVDTYVTYVIVPPLQGDSKTPPAR